MYIKDHIANYSLLEDEHIYYDLSKIADPYEIVRLEDCNGVLVLKEKDCCLEFALLEQSVSGDSYVYYTIIFHGYGMTDCLREFRHIWFGDEEGYSFYLNINAVRKAFDYLEKYFDYE